MNGASSSSALSTENETAARPLSVCLVSSISAAANGGREAYIRHLARHLVRRGHRVQGISRLHTDIQKNLRFEAFEDNRGQEIVFDGWRTRLIAPHAPYRLLVRRLLSLMTRPQLHSLAIAAFDAAYTDALLRALPGNADVVHFVGTGWEMLGFSALAAARRRNATFVVTPFVHPDRWGDSPLDIRLYQQADRIFVCSHQERDHLIARGVPPAILHKIDLGPASEAVGNARRFRARHALGDRPIILFVGRKKQNKGHHILRQSLSKIAEAVPDVCLVVVGSDGELPYPPAPDFNLRDLGIIDEQEKADAFAACDVFAMPSVGEAFGIVYTEAWEYGKPVVGGMAPALAELIEDDVNGYRVAQDVDAVASTLIRLLKDRALRERLGTAGRGLQQRRFTMESMVRIHEAVYVQAGKDSPDLKRTV